jgi:hypothetical protein
MSPLTIHELEVMLRSKPKEMSVRYDFAYFHPHGFHSWRGDYSCPAIGYSTEGECTVSDLLTMLTKLQVDTFYGYKGGEYTFSGSHVLHVSQPNEAASTVIFDVNCIDGNVILSTGVLV